MQRAKTSRSGLTTLALVALLCLGNHGCQLILGDLPPEIDDAGAPADDAEVVADGRRDADASGDDGSVRREDAQTMRDPGAAPRDASSGPRDDVPDGPRDDVPNGPSDGGDQARDAGSRPPQRDTGVAPPVDSGATVEPIDTGTREPDPPACTAAEERTLYRDQDRDGYGETASAMVVCGTSPGEDWVAQNGDCHDANADVHPTQPAFFGEGYRLPGSDRISFDYDCDGLENPGPAQEHAPDSCVGLLLCSGGGYLPNAARPAEPGINPYCGSNYESYCTLQALLCQDTPQTTDRHYVCN